MDDNVISFTERRRIRDEDARMRVMKWIDRGEVYQYYVDIIEVSIRHFTRLQRYVAEEYLSEVISESFFRGVHASRQYEAGWTTEDIVNRYNQDHAALLYSLASEYRLSRHLGEWDLYSVSIIAEDVTGKWFQKGLAYGRKQRKLKLF
ncbi:DUF2521 family protein [Aneurinibacillus sp. BA2021]|nr:DUF2521 family protein [Aneurinibacillus sp. BA2021]